MFFILIYDAPLLHSLHADTYKINASDHRETCQTDEERLSYAIAPVPRSESRQRKLQQREHMSIYAHLCSHCSAALCCPSFTSLLSVSMCVCGVWMQSGFLRSASSQSLNAPGNTTLSSSIRSLGSVSLPPEALAANAALREELIALEAKKLEELKAFGLVATDSSH